jgi:hypothetical protein
MACDQGMPDEFGGAYTSGWQKGSLFLFPSILLSLKIC